MHLGGETAFKPYFDGTDVEPDSVEPEDIHTEYHAGANRRLDVDRYLDDEALDHEPARRRREQEEGHAVRPVRRSVPAAAVLPAVGGSQQPHNTGARPGLSQLRYGWESRRPR